MSATINVVPLLDNSSISLSAISLRHIECGQLFAMHHGTLSGQITLHCPCVLMVAVPLNGHAETQIKKAAIGAFPFELESGTYTSNRGEVSLVVGKAMTKPIGWSILSRRGYGQS